MSILEKLLLMGVDSSTKFAIDYARRIGVHTIVTDYNPPDSSVERRMADEQWTINVADLDALEARCRKEQVTGIYAGNHEFCLDMTKELCARLGLPFYAPDEGWTCARDKLQFKQRCIDCGLDVPKRYLLTKPFQPERLADISYPVIVKPTDACAQKGLSLCRNERELIAGYERALTFSGNGEIIVEEFIEGDELDVMYFLDNGTPHLININDKLLVQVNDRMNQTFLPNQSRYYHEFVDAVGERVERLFQSMHCRNGASFFQIIRRDGRYYFLEMGCRLDGIGSWTTTKPCFGFSNVEQMVNLALGRPVDVDWNAVDFSPEGKHSATYLFWAKPGRIADICGVEKAEAMEGVAFGMKRFQVGDEIHQTDNLLQVAFYIGLCASNTQKLIQKLMEINRTVLVLDENGQNLMIPYESYDTIQMYYE
ncbi:MAG: acetyl-CoA carboxylase biotin carboxylase subunit family protein [Butyricicoccus sp.]